MNLRERAELGMLKHQQHRETIKHLEAKNAKLRDRVAELEASLATQTGESLPVQGVVEGFVLALQTVVDMPDGKKELGYTLLDGIGLFSSAEEVHDAIGELSLPLGWVSIKTSQLLPGWMLPPTGASK